MTRHPRSGIRSASWTVVAGLIVVGSTFVSVVESNVEAGATSPPLLFGKMNVVSPDSSGGGSLVDLTCVSSTSCIGVGTDNAPSNQEVFSVGTQSGVLWSWSTTKVVSPDGSGGGVLYGVACPTATTCVAVGQDNDDQSIATSGTYSSSSWSWTSSEVLSSESSGFSVLNSVACPETNTCIAVGEDNSAKSVYTIGTEVAGAWSWSTPAEITPDSSGYGTLYSVSCASPVACVAVGEDGGSQAIVTSASRSGSTWTWTNSSTVASDTTGEGLLASVDCPTPTVCVAVGEDGDNYSDATTGTLSGGSWSWLPERAYGVGGFDESITDVSCSSSTFCLAVGQDNYSGGQPSYFVGTSTSGTWTWTPPSEPAGESVGGGFNGVDCVSSTLCITAGFDNQGNEITAVYSPLPIPPEVSAIGANGSADVSWLIWSVPESSVTGYSIDATNVTTSTTSTNVCATSDTSTTQSCDITGLINGDAYTFSVAAINAYGTGEQSEPTGVISPSSSLPSFTGDITPDTAGATTLAAVSCASATSCMAVGSDNNAIPTFSTGTESAGVWSWSTDAAMASGGPQGEASSVSCPSTTACVAVGAFNDSTTLVSEAAYSASAWSWTTR